MLFKYRIMCVCCISERTNKHGELTGHELSRALGSPPAVDLSADADGVLLTGCQARLGEGGQSTLHLHSYPLVALLLFGPEEQHK